MKIFVAGTFDNFHVGHQYLLWGAYRQCENLIVVVARDETVKRIKGRRPKNNEKARLDRLRKEFEGFGGVDIALGRTDGDFLKTLQQHDPTHLLLGYDQQADVSKIQKKLPKIHVVRAKPYRPELFKSSKF